MGDDAVKAVNPLVQPTVEGIHVLDVDGAAHAYARAQVHPRMLDAELPAPSVKIVVASSNWSSTLP